MNTKTTGVDLPSATPTDSISAELMLIGWIDWLRPYAIHVTVAVALLLLAVVGLVYADSKTKMKTAAAYHELHEIVGEDLDKITDEAELRKETGARKEKLKALIDRFPESPVTINAELQVAQLEFRIGNLASAASLFKKFQEQHPQQHSLVTLAVVGEADCLFASDDFAAAKEKYTNARDRLKDGASDSYVAGHVRFQAAVCTWLLGDAAGAKTLFDELLASKTEESIEKRAQAFMDGMEIFPPEEFKTAIVAAKAATPEISAPPVTEIAPVPAPAVPSGQ